MALFSYSFNTHREPYCISIFKDRKIYHSDIQFFTILKTFGKYNPSFGQKTTGFIPNAFFNLKIQGKFKSNKSKKS
ncbi:hypothetical protein P872_07550 [Rhodonellum psychrophilum GCM71 = DSM 17998]|uniref:Uncharacterized protein n=1 Tax=Rhodonellum psychrophilum GCM71 = DSM 17998 TaxID=1123057 RepID=U5BZA7_9BACT|nr:hypothetical protein P872_07550 [Rhodonellum psychrophilum GCM71 = DSM 17998]